MPPVQHFKGDEEELKFYNAGVPVCDQLALSKDQFFNQAYECFVLGDLLYDSGRSPLANAIPKKIFRESFPIIYESFVFVGSFESYLTVFRHIFGTSVEVTFTVHDPEDEESPEPGVLLIDIVAAGVQLYDFTIRRIEDNTYIFSRLITHDGNVILLQGVKGFQSQYELEQMLYEMVPQGIYTEITLTLGEEEEE